MPKYQPINLIGGFYTDDSLSWAAQDTVNWLPLAAEVDGTRTVTKLRSPPGLSLFSDIGSDPIRETHNVEGRLFTVSGGSLYEVSTSGFATNRGAIPGVGRVSMAHNQITFGNQLTVVNGDSGYVWNTVTSTLTKITDPGFEGSIQVDFLNGFMIHLDPFGRFWFHSQPADALSFNTLDRYTSESSPDNMVGVKVFQSEVVVFNDSTIDFFGLTGSGELGEVFERKNIVINRGCASRNSIARVNNTLAWLGDDGAVYVLNGYREQKISTIPIEQAIAGLNWSQAFAEVWEDQGHTIYYLTFPDGKTWGYDFNSGLWTRRESYELSRWRMTSITFWQGKWIVGDFQVGKLYELKWDFFTENGRPLVSYRATGYSHSDQNRVLCPYMELMFDTGWSPNPNDLDPLIIQGDAPDQLVNAPYSFTYTATGGFGIYSFSTPGPLPAGLTLSTSGVLSGIPSSTGSFSFTVTVTDSLGNTASVPDTVQIAFAPNLLLARSNGVSLRSGLTSSFNEIQSIVTTGGAVLDVVLNNGATYAALCQTNAPFFQMFKRNSLGAYIDDSVNVSPVPGSSVQAACFTPDGNYLGLRLGSTEMRLYKFNGTTYTQTSSVISSNIAGHMSWDPTGTYIATGGAGNLGRIWTRTGDTLALTQGINLAGSSGGGTAWRGDKVVFSGTLRHAVYQMIAGTATLLDDINPPAAGNADIVWSPDGLFLFVSNATAPFLTAFSWNGVTLTQLANPPQPAFSPTTVPTINMTRDGRFVALTSSNAAGGTVVYERSGGTLTQLTLIPYGLANSNSFATSTDYMP